MIIYGVALLAFCYLGKILGVNANVGGVGFAMILLVLIGDWLKRKGHLDFTSESGVQFWSQMYIPIVVAMSATQNVKVAVSSGLLAVLAGIIPVILCFVLIPFISKFSKQKTTF
jgi:malonate transporter MadL subunit